MGHLKRTLLGPIQILVIIGWRFYISIHSLDGQHFLCWSRSCSPLILMQAISPACSWPVSGRTVFALVLNCGWEAGSPQALTGLEVPFPWKSLFNTCFLRVWLLLFSHRNPLLFTSYEIRMQEDFTVGWTVEDSSTVDTINPWSSLGGGGGAPFEWVCRLNQPTGMLRTEKVNYQGLLEGSVSKIFPPYLEGDSFVRLPGNICWVPAGHCAGGTPRTACRSSWA